MDRPIARARGEQAAIRADRYAQTGDWTRQGDRRAEGLPTEVMPFPPAEGRRARGQKLLGAAGVARRPLTGREADRAEVVLFFQAGTHVSLGPGAGLGAGRPLPLEEERTDPDGRDGDDRDRADDPDGRRVPACPADHALACAGGPGDDRFAGQPPREILRHAAADGYRLSGSRSRHFRQTVSRSRRIEKSICRGRTGSHSRTRRIVSMGVGASWTFLPVSSS